MVQSLNMNIYTAWRKTLHDVQVWHTVQQPNEKVDNRQTYSNSEKSLSLCEHKQDKNNTVSRQHTETYTEMEGRSTQLKEGAEKTSKQTRLHPTTWKKQMKGVWHQMSNSKQPKTTWDVQRNQSEAHHSEQWRVMTRLRAGSTMRLMGQQAYAVCAIPVSGLPVLRPVEWRWAHTSVRGHRGHSGGVGLVGLR